MLPLSVVLFAGDGFIAVDARGGRVNGDRASSESWACPQDVPPGSWTLKRRGGAAQLRQQAIDVAFERLVEHVAARPVSCELPWSSYRTVDRVRTSCDWSAGHIVVVPAPARVFVGGLGDPVPCDTVLDPSIPEAVAGLRPRVALLPINGRDRVCEQMDVVDNLTVREAAHLADVVGAHFLIPCHHDLFAVNSELVAVFVAILEREFPAQEYLIPKPGRTVVLADI